MGLCEGICQSEIATIWIALLLSLNMFTKQPHGFAEQARS